MLVHALVAGGALAREVELQALRLRDRSLALGCLARRALGGRLGCLGLGRAGTRCAGGAGRLPSGLRSASPLLALPLLLVFGLGRRKRAQPLLVVSTASIMAEPILPFLLGESRLFDAVEAGALNACPVRTIDVAAAGALDGVPYRLARLVVEDSAAYDADGGAGRVGRVVQAGGRSEARQELRRVEALLGRALEDAAGALRHAPLAPLVGREGGLLVAASRESQPHLLPLVLVSHPCLELVCCAVEA
mmetsp:Transcript_23831/g.79196  ORF Transcript_23831/g.79196 Transcript_23831/m.79196 type:complete len:248 (+) Transcript_23831:3-746(+)